MLYGPHQVSTISDLLIASPLELRRFVVPFRISDHSTRFRLQSVFNDLLFPDFEGFFDSLHHVIPGLLVKDRHEILFLELRHRVREPRFIPESLGPGFNQFFVLNWPFELSGGCRVVLAHVFGQWASFSRASLSRAACPDTPCPPRNRSVER